MTLRWLHISDFHFRGGDPYDRDVVLRALVCAVRTYRERGRQPDLIFATGDIAQFGKAQEYARASAFFDAILGAAGLERRQLFVVPGNHDVDRDQAIGLARTLGSREEADRYFAPALPKPHLTQKMGAFRAWYDDYFRGIRALPADSTCGPVERIDVRGRGVAVLPVNSALFCIDDHDHAQLIVGRRCLDEAIAALGAQDAALRVALIHHPLDWLSKIEHSNIKSRLANEVDVILRGHLHENEVEDVQSGAGGVVHLAAGASYQTRQRPNRALYCTVDGAELRIFPIRYEDSPTEVWTVDPSLFPAAPGYEGLFSLHRLAPAAPASPPPAVTAPAAPASPPPAVTAPAATSAFRSNIPTRGKHPFVGREALLQAIEAALGDPAADKLLVLHGPPGVGKSELAREFARAAQRRYPGGSFQLRMGGGLGALDLARIGSNHLQLHFPAELPPEDQAERTLLALAAAPSLLIFDNVVDADEMRPWLPRAGMPCHVLVTSWNETLALDWAALPVPPLSDRAARQLVDEVAGNGVPAATRRALLTQSDGLPVHLLPAARALAVGARRGRPGAPLVLGADAEASFRVPYDTLDAGARLLLHAAAFMNPQQIVADELRQAVADTSAGADFARHLDACQDFHLLEGADELRMHQLFAAFVLAQPRDAALQAAVDGLRAAQWQRCVALARAVAANPAADGQVYRLLAYRLAPADWLAAELPAPGGEGEWLGQALVEIGRFAAARPWFERAVTEKAQGDVHGRVDHASLGSSLHQVGYCLSCVGEFAVARPWYERAVTEKAQGDVHGRVDHASLGISLNLVGYCLSSLGEFADARPWFERAVTEKERGDVHGRVDHESLGSSLHHVGYCLSSLGEFAAARPWFERAVAEAERGDVHGRVNHESLGTSLHQVGYCLSRVGEFADARPWYERAVAEKERGDVHGRVDHASLGSSLHLVGYCLSSLGEFAAARPWFERAVTEKAQGDVHGRVDHESLGISLNLVGYCLSSLGEFADARPWFERAVAEAEQGDVHGRVDHASLGTSLHQVGYCLASVGEFAAARPWFERAVAEKERGDVHGRVNHASLGASLHQVGYCLSSLGEFADARPWYERAVAEKERGDVHGRVDHASLGASLHQVGYCLASVGEFAAARPWFERAVAEKERGDVFGRVDAESLAIARRSLARCIAAIDASQDLASPDAD